MKIVLAGAGTAGHIEPALAVADAWRREFPQTQFEFVGTSTGLENTLVTNAGFHLNLIPKVVFPRRISLTAFSAPLRFLQAVIKSHKIVKGSDCVIGFGGYVSAPIYLAAALNRTPFVIHEANAIPGWANKFGAALGGAMAVGKPVTAGKFKTANVVGLPLKPTITSALDSAKKDWQSARLKAKVKIDNQSEKPLILVIGGSQGSVAINKVIANTLNSLLPKYNFLHSVGGKNELPMSIPGYQPVSYIEDMATAYLAADLIIARSGAITCAEVNALGKFALFIPLEIGNGEQARNADFLVSQNRALVINQSEFTSRWLLENLDNLLQKSATNAAGDESDRAAASNIVALMRRHARIS